MSYQELTVAQPKYFNGHNLKTDYLIKTRSVNRKLLVRSDGDGIIRLIATTNPNQFLITLGERFLHQTRLGAWLLRRYNRKKDAARVSEADPD